MAEVLLVEDDNALREQLRRHLEQGGHTIIECTSGREALESIMDTAFDAVILDIKLPELTGIDVLREIRQELPSHPPVIMITGHGDKSNAIKAIHYGAFDFLEKPFSPQLIDLTLQRALTERKHEILQFRSLVEARTRSELTVREREVAALASNGLTNDEIANRLGLGSETVKTHLKKIFRKLGITQRADLAQKIKE